MHQYNNRKKARQTSNSGTHQSAVVKGQLIGPKSINGEIPAERSKTDYFSNINDGKQVTDPRSSE